MGRQLAAAALEVAEGTAEMRMLDAAGEEPARLHQLMARIVNGRRRVIDGADERKLVRDLGRLREHVGDSGCRGRWC